MADRYLLESGAPDGYLLEDGSGVLLLEAFDETAMVPLYQSRPQLRWPDPEIVPSGLGPPEFIPS